MVIPFPRIPPDIVSIGPLTLRWYGLMYVVGYALGYKLASMLIARRLSPLTKSHLDTLLVFLVVGMLIGARTIYVLVYDLPAYKSDPLGALEVWRGGLSFHGAILGMAGAIWIFARRYGIPTLTVTDLVALCGSPGLFFGRIGNFINAELYGRPTDVPWAMVFPTDGLRLPRHPSQLYEALGEGILLSIFLWWLDYRLRSRGEQGHGILTAAFLMGYAVIRFLVEFTREPDSQLGLVFGPFSMGQGLSVLMFSIGAAVLAIVTRRRKTANHH